MKISVTQEHIYSASCHKCYCPIALAIKDAFDVPDVSDEFVDVEECGVVELKELNKTIPLPDHAVDFIDSYDAWARRTTNYCPKPFEFELEI